jgi:TPP-dependent 2-oxoacid decarboxylase
LFERINFSITDNTIVIADVGDSLFGALDLTIHGQTDFYLLLITVQWDLLSLQLLELN